MRHHNSLQCFTGNLFHEVDKSELKDGNEVELYVNNGGNLPSFGFAVFVDPESLPNIFSSKPVMFRSEVSMWKRTLEPPGMRSEGPQRCLSEGGLMSTPGFGMGREIAPSKLSPL